MKIFFDVDGVLIDGWHSDPARRKPWDVTIEQDLGIDRSAFRQKFFHSPSGAFNSVMHACVAGKRDLKEALAEVLPAVGYAGAVDAFIAYWFEKDSNVNQDVLKIVKHLGQNEDLELYIATGQEHYRAAYLWTQLGFRKHFKEIFYSARLGHLKDTPAFFRTVNQRLEIGARDRPLFFDDQDVVVQLARAAGWDACKFNSVRDLQGHPTIRRLLAS